MNSSAGGGGGSAGSILITASDISLNNNVTTALGGNGGAGSVGASDPGGRGGAGSPGGIRIEYCESLTGTTAPPASTQKLNCYIVEQVETASYTTARLNLPAAVNGSATYNVQFGRKLDFATAGNQLTSLRVPAGMIGSVKFDVLASGLGANSAVSVDVGDDGSVEWSGPVANNSTNASPELAEAFNAYWAAHGALATGTIDVPVRVSIGGAGQLLLSNLQLQSAASRVRSVRLPVRNYTQFLLDFTAGGSGSVVAALDVGDNGSIDWSTPAAGAAPARWQTGDLKAALNAYLTGKSGEQTVPIRIYVAPSGTVTLNDYTATYAPQTDLAADNLIVGTTVAAAGTDSPLYHDGDQLAVQASLRNTSNTDSGPVTAAFFANAPGWGDWYIGSAFVNNIAANGSVTVSAPWNTTGFGSDLPVAVKVVVNPYHRIGETNLLNNSKSVNATITPTQVAQTLTFATLPDKMLTDPDFALVATAAPSGLTVNFSSMTPSVCTVSGSTVTLRVTGTCTIQATQIGNAFFLTATPVSQSFAVKSDKPDQTITFAVLPNKILGDAPFALNATAIPSGLLVSFSAKTPGVCTVSGNTVTLVTIGICSIQATQDGDNTYDPATPVTQSFTVQQPGKTNQTITFAELLGKTFGDPPFALSATASSNLPVNFATQTPIICTVNGNTVTLSTVGICTIRASQAGNPSFNAAADVDRSFTIGSKSVTKLDQTITFAQPTDKTLGNPTFTLNATASSGLPVSFAVETPAVCTVSGNMLTLMGVGVCTIVATQDGNEVYNPAAAVTRSFTVNRVVEDTWQRVFLPLVRR